MKHHRLSTLGWVIGIVLFSLAIGGVAVRGAGRDRPEPDPVSPARVATEIIIDPSHVLVKFRAGVRPAAHSRGGVQTGLATLDGTLARYDVKAAEPLFRAAAAGGMEGERVQPDDQGLARIHRLTLPAGSDAWSVVEALAADPAVEWAEVDYVAHAADTTPDDPLFGEQWGLAKIEAPAAWDVVTGTETVVIAVLDSGLDMSHGDLSGQLWTNPGETPGNGLDEDSNTYVDDVHGWDFVNDDNDPSDDNGHGTQVAGIAAAGADDGLGMAGMCWNCRVMPVKVMQISGVANYSDIAAGVYYAADKGAEVINISLGGYADSTTLREAVEYAAQDKGAVVVAGAGNDGVSDPFYPAAYPEVLAVAGTDADDVKAGFSDYGAWVDVSAPGVAITTTFLGGDWGPAQGTSFAAPFAAGLAGLLRSQHPEWSEALVRAQMMHRADGIDAHNPGYAGQLGQGRLNAGAAVSQPPHPILELEGTRVNGEAGGRPTPGEDATLAVTLGNDWLDAGAVTGTLHTTDPHVTLGRSVAAFGDIVSGATGESSPVYTFTVAGDAGYSHAMPFTLQVYANDGAYSTTLALTVTTRSAEEPVAGTIAADTVWTHDKTYIVQGNIGVAPGYTLTIEPETEVRFDGNYALNVGGTLVADGTSDRPIRFVSHSGATWDGIHFADSSADVVLDADYGYVSGSILRHVHIEDAVSLSCASATPYMAHLSAVNVTDIDWTPGTLKVGTLVLPGQALLTDSSIVDAKGILGFVVGSSSLPDGVFIHGDAHYLRNEVIHGQVHIGGTATVISSSVTHGALRVGQNSLVLTNTVSGGIRAGDGSTLRRNDVQGTTEEWGIESDGVITATANRLVGNAYGLRANGGWIQDNLIANNRGVGLELSGDATVISNTFTGNGGSAIVLSDGNAFQISGNNLEGNRGPYDVENQIPGTTLALLPAQDNWWGTMDTVAIAQRIFDFSDDFDIGEVAYAPVLTGPVQAAPAYVRAITLTPASPVGIEPVTFDVAFSREMAREPAAEVSFRSTLHGTWEVFTSANSGLSDYVKSIAVDVDRSVWFGTSDSGVAHFGQTWTVYDTRNSGLPSNYVRSIAMDVDGSRWFGTDGSGVAHFDGEMWAVYDVSNSGLPNDFVGSVVVDVDGSKWFGTDGGGVARFDGETWTVYRTGNSDLPDDNITAVAIDIDGSKWFGTDEGDVARFDDETWTVYNERNSGLPHGKVKSIAVDMDGGKWFGVGFDAWHSLVYFDGAMWVMYSTDNSGLPHDNVQSIAVDMDCNKWFGTNGGGAAVLYSYPTYPIVDQPQWPAADHYQASYAIDALVPRDTYSVTVQGAVGGDGIEIAPNSATTFIVDYAGAIGDTTPPEAPIVLACGADSADTLSARWTARDPDGSITRYRYAIGTTTGGTDVINWTETVETHFQRTNLNLTAGQTYYVAVQARNAGGLWSAIGVSSGVVAGAGTCPDAGFSAAPRSGSAPLEVQFTDVSSGTVEGWEWSFGDGVTSTLQHPVHTFSSGIYTVSLQVSGPGGGDLLSEPGYITVEAGGSVYLPLVMRD